MTRITNQQMLANLEASGIAADATKFPKEVHRGNRNQESAIQSRLIWWWLTVCDHYDLPDFALMSIPMGGIRNIVTASILKREGARRGSLDLFLSVARRGSHGQWIEMKSDLGVLSYAQIDMMNHLNSQGYKVAVCRSVEDAQKVITDYLGTNQPASGSSSG